MKSLAIRMPRAVIVSLAAVTTTLGLLTAAQLIAEPGVPASPDSPGPGHLHVFYDPGAGNVGLGARDQSQDPHAVALQRRIIQDWPKIAASAPAPAAGANVDIGDIAVLVDDGTLVVPDGAGGLVTDTGAIVTRFYQTHQDLYDEVVAFTSNGFPSTPQPEAGFAFFGGFATFTANINSGQGISSFSSSLGLTRALGELNMNNLGVYPASPTQDFLGGVASAVEIFGQEAEHAFAAFVQADNGDILGRGNAHWSFFLSHPGVGNASPMEGNRWQDNGDGTFTTVESFTGYGELDEYLMGLRDPATMQPFFLIQSNAFADSSFPAPNVTVSGTRVNMTINNIINLNGPRMPDTTTAMNTFRQAFILVIPAGTTATTADLNKINAFVSAWKTYFNTTTEGLGSIQSSLGLPVGTALPFADSFDAGPRPDETLWSYHQGAVINALGLNEPTGNSSLHLDGQWGGADEIRSRTIDLSAEPGVITVNYSVERGGGATAPTAGQNLVVEYLNSSMVWTNVRTIAGNGSTESTFTTFSDALPADANHDRFRIRFRRLRPQLTGVDNGSFFVDDVSVTAQMLPCPADVNGDGVVDGVDISAILNQFGGPGSADLNNDGIVDGVDLALVLNGFGPCP